jgi:hypothetical protein
MSSRERVMSSRERFMPSHGSFVNGLLARKRSTLIPSAAREVFHAAGDVTQSKFLKMHDFLSTIHPRPEQLTPQRGTL